MKELEITVKVNCSFEELNKYLLDKGFKIVDKYSCYDRYMIDKNIDISKMKDLDVLDKCILARRIGTSKKCLTYKKRIYDENENIISQTKLDCIVDDVDQAIKFMESIGYKVLFEIYDELVVYSNGKIEFASQMVNDKYLLIEMEDKSSITPKHNYDNIDDMIKDFEKVGIDYDKSNYFVKKAQIVLNEVR